MAQTPRNTFARLAATRRGGVHQDRRRPRAGSKNPEREWLYDYEIEKAEIMNALNSPPPSA